MSAVQHSPIKRRESKKIWVGKVPVGGDAPISVQSMTNTRTTDVEATVAQIKSLEKVGADIVRVSVPTMDAAEAFKVIKQQVNVPLVADIHFDYRIALKVAEYGVDCLRINPGNIGNEERIRAVVDCAKDKNIPIRIGVNAGSLERDLQEKYGEPTQDDGTKMSWCADPIIEKGVKITIKCDENRGPILVRQGTIIFLRDSRERDNKTAVQPKL